MELNQKKNRGGIMSCFTNVELSSTLGKSLEEVTQGLELQVCGATAALHAGGFQVVFPALPGKQ